MPKSDPPDINGMRLRDLGFFWSRLVNALLTLGFPLLSLWITNSCLMVGWRFRKLIKLRKGKPPFWGLSALTPTRIHHQYPVASSGADVYVLWTYAKLPGYIKSSHSPPYSDQ